VKWLVHLLAAALVLISFPVSIALSKNATRRGDAGGVTMMIGLAFVTVVDPRLAAAIEMIENRREVGHVEQDPVDGTPRA